MVRKGTNFSMFVVNGEYLLSSFTDPVKAGDVNTVFGCAVILSNVNTSPSLSLAISVNSRLVCFSSDSHAFTAILPFVVEDNLNTASDASRARQSVVSGK